MKIRDKKGRFVKGYKRTKKITKRILFTKRIKRLLTLTVKTFDKQLINTVCSNTPAPIGGRITSKQKGRKIKIKLSYPTKP